VCSKTGAGGGGNSGEKASTEEQCDYQVPVTPWNVSELRAMVLNRPVIHPGAVMVENEFEQMTILESKNRAQREGIVKTLLTPSGSSGGRSSRRLKIVYRHLKNRDAMLLNRQPTHRKPSIVAHKAGVLKGEKVM